MLKPWVGWGGGWRPLSSEAQSWSGHLGLRASLRTTGLCKPQWVALVTGVLALALALPLPSWLIGHLPPQGPSDPQAWARAHGHKQPAVTRSHMHTSHGVGKAASSGSWLGSSGTPLLAASLPDAPSLLCAAPPPSLLCPPTCL